MVLKDFLEEAGWMFQEAEHCGYKAQGRTTLGVFVAQEGPSWSGGGRS